MLWGGRRRVFIYEGEIHGRQLCTRHRSASQCWAACGRSHHRRHHHGADFLILIGGTVAKSLSDDGDSISTGAAFAGGLLGVAIGALYEVYMTSHGGQTVGKKVMKIKIVRLADGQTPDLNTAVKRWLPNAVGIIPTIGSPLSALIGIASLVLVFTDMSPERQRQVRQNGRRRRLTHRLLGARRCSRAFVAARCWHTGGRGSTPASRHHSRVSRLVSVS